jgi:hypothetical protein
VDARDHIRRLAYQYRELATKAYAEGEFSDAASHAEVAQMFEDELRQMEAKRKPSLPSDPFQGFRDEPRADKARG